MEAARTAVGHLRRTGARDYMAVGLANLGLALFTLGEWDTAAAEFAHAADADGLAGNEILVCHQAWLAALRGDADGAQTMLAALPDLRASEEPQSQALVAIVEAFIAAGRREPETTLRLARATLAYADAVGVNHESIGWAWPVAARAAWELGADAVSTELLAMLDALQPGQLTPMLRAERDLARARLAPAGDRAADLAAAITGLRERSSPFNLAHGLLDQAAELTRRGEPDAGAAAADEAIAIAAQLRCQPLLDRAADLTAPAKAAAGARPRTRATGTVP